MLIKRISKHGNSWALVIEKSILDILGITQETNLHIMTDGKGLFIIPVKQGDKERDEKPLA